MLELFVAYFYLFGAVFLLFNIGIGLLMVWTAERSPVAPFFQRCSGVVAPYFVTLALLFGLYSSFLASDVWAVREKAQAAVEREANAIRVVLRVTEALGERGKTLHDLVLDYGRITAGRGWLSTASQPFTAPAIRRMLAETMSGAAAGAGPEIQRTAIDPIMDMRAARSDRVVVALSHTDSHKWMAVFIFGVLTQAALVAVHLGGNPRASALAVTLFAVGMTTSMMVILDGTHPFSGRNPVSLHAIAAALASASEN